MNCPAGTLVCLNYIAGKTSYVEQGQGLIYQSLKLRRESLRINLDTARPVEKRGI